MPPARSASPRPPVSSAAAPASSTTGSTPGSSTARRGPGNRLCIPWDAQVRAGCQELITQSARLGRAARPRTLPAPPSPAAEGEVSVTEAAYQLGCSTYVIYDWIETGKLAARRGAGNRLHIPWKEQVQAQCRARIEQSGHLNPEARKTKPRQRPAALSSPGMSVPAAIVTTQAPRPWPAPIPRHRIQPNTRLQEGQYEITVPTVADRVAQRWPSAAGWRLVL